MDFFDLGKCYIDNIPTTMFFDGYEKANLQGKQKILATCGACQVKTECYDYAVINELTGVFGGVFFEDGNPLRSDPLKRKFLERRRDARARKESQETLDSALVVC